MPNDVNHHEPLLAALIEIERFVSGPGWDQPARLFALVSTRDLLAAEPSLAGQIVPTAPDALSSIEQDDFNPAGEDLMNVLAHLSWPATVDGCALATERSFLPAQFEADLPADPIKAAQVVANHPQRQDLRVVAGAVRTASGNPLTHCVARLASQPDEILVGADMVPALTRALALTL